MHGTLLHDRCIISRATKSILAPLNGRTITLFPAAQQISHQARDYLVVPHDIHSTICLRMIGYQIPNPMLCYYNWKGGTPFAVQRSTCDLLTTNQRAYVLNDMGTGKTKAALWAWDYLNEQGLAGNLLVVATLSTLYAVWGAEAFATLPGRKVAILHGTKKRRLELLNSDANIYVVNHDGLRTIKEALAARTDIDCLVLDELAVYRNNSERSKLMRKFAPRFKIVWGLTGAPMPQAPTDVWAQTKIITPHTSPSSFRLAQELLMERATYSQFVWKPKPNAVETAFKMLQPSVRYSLDSVVELPEVIHRTIEVPLSKQQKETYEAVSKAFQADVAGKKITAVNAAVAMGKLLQIAGGYVYAGETRGVATLDHAERVQTLIDLVQSNERKVLIFAPFIHTIKGLSRALDDEKIEHAVVHGDISPNDRADIFRVFQQTTKYKALLAHPQCLAHGLTLTAADTIIWYQPVTSLEIYDQANARITRVGQKHKQKIYHLQSTAVERRIYKLLQDKAKVQNQLLDMLAEATDDPEGFRARIVFADRFAPR